jgi:ATP-dependent exoDNAse (exonuclease V) beta subunit
MKLPPALSDADERLLRAFRQRYERLVAASARVPLERLCERIVSEHDYDLAVLAQWDGKRRYANLRKLARLARSYEELRGRDIEGFVRFVRQQEAVGARELEAVAEEEGTDAVRLLTIHAAKGLEFKVVIVADAGRDRPAPAPDEILALSDGRFGFKVADPYTSKRRGAFAYEEVRAARAAEDRAERLRLYYVAMTRAVDRLIVSGALDPEKEDETPIGWVLRRVEPGAELARALEAPVELERGDARLLLRIERYEPGEGVEDPVPEPADAESAEPQQLSLFNSVADEAAAPAPVLPALEPLPAPPLYDVRSLSYSAISLFERCSYRFFAERVAGMRERRPAGTATGGDGLVATEIGDAAHRLLEQVDLSTPAVPDVEQVSAWYPAATAEEIERVRSLVAAYCDSDLAARIARLEGVKAERRFTFEHDGVLFHGFLDVFHTADGRALVVDYKTNVLGELTPAEVVEGEYHVQRLVYALACFRAGSAEVEVAYQFLERPEEVVSAVFTRDDVPALEQELSAAIARIRSGVFGPNPSELACSGCPALDVICAGPRLPGRGSSPSRELAAAPSAA